MTDILFLVAILLGLLACFYGYRLFKFFLAIGGVVAGALGGWYLWHVMAGGSTVVAFALVIVGALVGGWLAVTIFYAGVFLLGMNAFMGIGYMLFGNAAAAIATGIAGGVLCIFLQKYMIIIATAYGGASAVARALQDLAPRLGRGTVLVGVLVLGTIGLLAQIGMLRSRRSA